MSTTYLYVIGREEGPVKVGITNSLTGRISAIQTGCPFRIKLLHAQPMRNRDHALLHERWFHASYEEKRLHGEWFDLEYELAVEMIETSLEHELAHERGLLS